MRIHEKREQRAKRKREALKLLESGRQAKEVAKIIGVTERSVRYWQKEAREPKDKSGVRPVGRPSRLSNEQLEKLRQELLRGASKQGYAEDYWTLDRIALLILEKFKVRYHPGSLGKLMQRIGWSNERPLQKKLQRSKLWKERYIVKNKKGGVS